MEYDDGSRRLNLLSGIVLGTLLGAGLALLLVPGEGPAEKARFVVRAARRVGAGARRPHAYARDLRARLEHPDGDEPDDEADREMASAVSADADADDDGEGRDEGTPRVRAQMARRRFKL